MSAKLRLVKVAVQPFFNLDDGENLAEIDHPVVVIPADEWPTYSSERFPAEIEAWQARIDTEAVEQGPTANRAAHKAKRGKA